MQFMRVLVFVLLFPIAIIVGIVLGIIEIIKEWYLMVFGGNCR